MTLAFSLESITFPTRLLPFSTPPSRQPLSTNFHCLLLGGPGTGKTYILQLNESLLQHFYGDDVSAAGAYMHSAARLIDGRTLHSLFGLSLQDGHQSAAALRQLRPYWQQRRLLRIDEISTVSAALFGRCEIASRKVRQEPNLAWGGLLLDLSGDPHQLPPVGEPTLFADLQPPANTTVEQRAHWVEEQRDAVHGRNLFLQIPHCIILDYSHRCRDELADLLQDMFRGELANSTWHALQRRLLTHPSGITARQQVRDGAFRSPSCPIGVTRHNARAALSFNRELELAHRANKALLLSIAADRVVDASDSATLPPNIYAAILQTNNLTTTKHLPSVLALYTGAALLLEDKLCPELGLVRGCPCRLVSVCCDPREPPADPELGVQQLRYVPQGLLLEVADATWIHSPELGPGRFFLPSVRRTWTFKHQLPAPHGRTQTIAYQVERLQLPVINSSALTAYALQGRTVPKILLDLQRPPNMSRVPWLHRSLHPCLVDYCYHTTILPPRTMPRMNSGSRCTCYCLALPLSMTLYVYDCRSAVPSTAGHRRTCSKNFSDYGVQNERRSNDWIPSSSSGASTKHVLL